MTCPVFVGRFSQVNAIDSSPAAAGNSLWKSPWTSPDVPGGMVVVQFDAVNNLVMACINNFAYGLDPSSGTQTWRTQITSLDASPPSILLGTGSEYLYVAIENQVAAIVAKTGAAAPFESWWTPFQVASKSRMIQTSNHNLVVSYDEGICVLSPELNQLWSKDFSGAAPASLATDC